MKTYITYINNEFAGKGGHIATLTGCHVPRVGELVKINAQPKYGEPIMQSGRVVDVVWEQKNDSQLVSVIFTKVWGEL